MMSDEFHKFFDRTTRLMERAMCEDHQSLFVDYTGILPEYLEFKFWDLSVLRLHLISMQFH